MNHYAIFLRGVNVNGVTIRSAELLRTLGSLPPSGVTTYLASGNVTCGSDAGSPQVQDMVQAALRRDFGYDAWVVVMPLDRRAEIVRDVPYPADNPAVHAYITFGSNPGLLAELDTAAAAAGAEKRALGPEAVALPQAKGATLESPFARLDGKARYKASTKTRNVRTLQKMLAG